MSKQYIQDFDTSAEAWKFIATYYKLLKLNDQSARTLAVEYRKGKHWVVLKSE